MDEEEWIGVRGLGLVELLLRVLHSPVSCHQLTWFRVRAKTVISYHVIRIKRRRVAHHRSPKEEICDREEGRGEWRIIGIVRAARA